MQFKMHNNIISSRTDVSPTHKNLNLKNLSNTLLPKKEDLSSEKQFELERVCIYDVKI